MKELLDLIFEQSIELTREAVKAAQSDMTEEMGNERLSIFTPIGQEIDA